LDDVDDVDAASLVDPQQDVVGLDGRVVDDYGAVPRATHQMTARFQFDLPPGVGASCHRDLHDGMRVATALGAETGESYR
jgi:hypothetical protein